MIDINLIRNSPDLVKQNLKKRFQENKMAWVDEIIKGYSEALKLKKEIEELRRKRNIISLEINKLKKEGKTASNEIKEAKDLPLKISELEEKQVKLKEKINHYMLRIPNILEAKVPIGEDASKNKEIKREGKPVKPKFELKNHVELAESLNVADFEAGRNNAGQGFNYLLGDLALLDLALQRYGIDFLLKQKFKVVIPPMMLNKLTLAGAVDLEAFEQVIYKVEDEDLYMIGTAEHSLVSLMKNKSINDKDLPIKICAVTPCFRKEIGGHGVDMKGLFRMHQFNKVEQVIYCKPEDSLKYLKYTQELTEKFFKSLKIPFRVIEICSGDLGGKFAKQYDIEAWFPRQNEYKEVTSAGSCTDYQARRLNIKLLRDGKKEKEYVHILNNTMVATSRAMVAILENYQQKDGSVKIPLVLQKYMNEKKIIK